MSLGIKALDLQLRYLIEKIMHLDDILKLDIKLLVAFVTIMEEGSVSRAAERLNVTQPALSKSLQRLRESL
ncbi:LysR family transcriptional regulator [Marinomonas rhodophyticola]|uniref:LysR family transcriptional regulator n=1 Tax=Marinomonas rhodophyticola TaxID=2992803 RepID=A0ABT3KK47_9GAMM|nr:LysR family transcriptional regulator [Marinomonas sp. KJ51-3]MCW4630911.1 LysR family transcriptional regulator [Marinomonas sp. KJ51-3]